MSSSQESLKVQDDVSPIHHHTVYSYIKTSRYPIIGTIFIFQLKIIFIKLHPCRIYILLTAGQVIKSLDRYTHRVVRNTCMPCDRLCKVKLGKQMPCRETGNPHGVSLLQCCIFIELARFGNQAYSPDSQKR